MDFAEHLARMDSRRRTLGPDASCHRCGTRILAVLVTRARVTCYSCDLLLHGKLPFEDHHIGGRPSPFPALRISANLHRLLSIWQDLAWRGEHPGGSAQAIALDLWGLLVFGVAYARMVAA